MKLLQLMAGAERGGAEKFFQSLALALHADGLTQHIITRPGARAAALQQAGIPVTTARFGGLLDVTTRRTIKRTAAAFQPSLALVWMNRAARHCPALSIPVCARLGGYYDLKYYKNAHWLIGNTPDLQDYFIKQVWPQHRTAYLPNFTPMPSPFERIPPGTTLRLLAMGRLHKNKGFDTLLSALAQVPGAHLTLAGQGEEEASLKQQASALGIAGRVTFAGWQHSITPLFARADIFVCPSRHEPLGNVLLEAMAHRVPIVSTLNQGARHLLEHQQSALLMPIDDAAALAAAIIRLQQQPELAQRLVQGAYLAYQQGYTKEAVTARYQQFFAEVCNAWPTPPPPPT